MQQTCARICVKPSAAHPRKPIYPPTHTPYNTPSLCTYCFCACVCVCVCLCACVRVCVCVCPEVCVCCGVWWFFFPSLSLPSPPSQFRHRLFRRRDPPNRTKLVISARQGGSGRNCHLALAATYSLPYGTDLTCYTSNLATTIYTTLLVQQIVPGPRLGGGVVAVVIARPATTTNITITFSRTGLRLASLVPPTVSTSSAAPRPIAPPPRA